jgi:predicted nucleotidyltransferase
MNTMVDIIAKKHSVLVDLCRRCRVHRLYLFGSATGDQFDSARSDLDFLVSFSDRQPTGDYADRHLDFANGLEHLFGRSVDLITEQSIQNPYFRQEVEATRQLLYEQPNAKTTL